MQAAEEAGREGLANLDGELDHLKKEHGELQQLALEHKLSPAQFKLAEGAQRLAELREKRAKLKKWVDDIEKTLKEGEENKGLQQVLGRAELLEAQAEYGPAIALYEQVVKARPTEAKLLAHVDELKRGWAIKDDKHTAARAFVYETWPKLDVTNLKKNLDAARQAVATLKAAGDRLTLQKMKQAYAKHTASLAAELERLKRNDTDDNRNRAKALAVVSTSLAQMYEEITAFVGQRKE